MGLTARLASGRLHVLLVEIPGGRRLRMHAEGILAAEGHQLADSPADADVLLVCGTPNDRYEEVLGRLWDQLPAPRYRGRVQVPEEVAVELRAAVASIADGRAQGIEARPRPPRIEDQDQGGTGHQQGSGGHDHGGMDGHHGAAPHDPVVMGHEHGAARDEHGGMAHADPGAHEHAGMGHERGHVGEHDASTGHEHGTGGQHGGMDMDMDMDMDMAGPGGIALATGADDRDGLEMDELHVTLGPVLPAWPAGLVLRCTLHGDLVTEAEAEFLQPPGEEGGVLEDGHELAAQYCDDAAQLLTLAGWEPAALQVLAVRDQLLQRRARTERLARLTRRIEQSRTLRWSLRNTDRSLVDDVRDRLLQLLRNALATLEGRPTEDQPPVPVADLGGRLVGRDLAVVRLRLAGLSIDASPRAALHGEPAHG